MNTIIYVKIELKAATPQGFVTSIGHVYHGEAPGLPGFHRRAQAALDKLLGVPPVAKKPIRSALVKKWGEV